MIYEFCIEYERKKHENKVSFCIKSKNKIKKIYNQDNHNFIFIVDQYFILCIQSRELNEWKNIMRK